MLAGGACRVVSEPTPGCPALGAPGVDGAGGGLTLEPLDGVEGAGCGTVGEVPTGAGDVGVPASLAPDPD